MREGMKLEDKDNLCKIAKINLEQTDLVTLPKFMKIDEASQKLEWRVHQAWLRKDQLSHW